MSKLLGNVAVGAKLVSAAVSLATTFDSKCVESLRPSTVKRALCASSSSLS